MLSTPLILEPYLKLHKPDDFKAHSLTHTQHMSLNYVVVKIIFTTSAVILNKQTSKKFKQLCLKLYNPDDFKAHSLSHTAHVLLAGLQAHNDVDMKKQLI